MSGPQEGCCVPADPAMRVADHRLTGSAAAPARRAAFVTGPITGCGPTASLNVSSYSSSSTPNARALGRPSPASRWSASTSRNHVLGPPRRERLPLDPRRLRCRVPHLVHRSAGDVEHLSLAELALDAVHLGGQPAFEDREALVLGGMQVLRRRAALGPVDGLDLEHLGAPTASRSRTRSVSACTRRRSCRVLAPRSFSHHVEGRLPAGPDPERLRALADQHLDAVDHLGAELAGAAHQLGVAVAVDEVDQRDVRSQARRGRAAEPRTGRRPRRRGRARCS